MSCKFLYWLTIDKSSTFHYINHRFINFLNLLVLPFEVNHLDRVHGNF